MKESKKNPEWEVVNKKINKKSIGRKISEYLSGLK